ncbi:MAG: hypothetical protein QM692_21925 [Thermomicrobiales bacterium]
MDPSRFDSLARRLTGRLGRRTALHTVGAGLAALALKPAPVSTVDAKGNKKKQKRKEKEKRICRNKFGPGLGTFCRGVGCFDLQTDPAHCGGCNNACAAGQTCVNGSCTTPGCTPNCAGQACGAPNGCGDICTVGSCPAGQTCSNDGVCVAGNCNPACGYNLTCQGSTCVPQPNRCPAPFICSGFGGDAPYCGDVAGLGGVVGTCGCYRSTEGNNVCVNESDADGDDIEFTDLISCTSSQFCRERLGFHWYCRAVATSGTGLTCGSTVGRCWPTCDSPAI